MRVQAFSAGVVGIAALACVTSVTLSSQLPPFKAPDIKLPEGDAGRPRAKVPFSANIKVTDFEAASKPAVLNRSMTTRRQVAWDIVRSVWMGVPLPDDPHSIPTWTTWYDQEDLAQLYDDMLRRRRERTGIDAVTEVDTTLRARAFKDLDASTRSARLLKPLRQFSFREMREIGPHRNTGRGAIYYSPAYVRHFLANADRIVNCDASAFPTPGSKSRRSDLPTLISAPLGIDEVPAPLRPADGKNLHALCMDKEMPPDAVMIKTAWYPVRRAPLVETPARPPREIVWIPGQRYFQLDAAMAAALDDGPAGRWVEKPYLNPAAARMTPPGEGWMGSFIVRDESGQEWTLLGMHIAAKTIPTWLWISLFYDNGWTWKADKFPVADRFRGDPRLGTGSFYHYNMCVASDFREGDPQPSAAYAAEPGQQPDRREERINTFIAVAAAMKGFQWCSNPYIETNMARGNCIGCHQGSPVSFLPRTLAKQQDFNISDFSFSFETNRNALIDIRRRYGVR